MAILSLIGAFLLGLAIPLFVVKVNGILHINTYDSNKDVYSFELFTPLNEIPRRKFLVFKVKIDEETDVA